MCTSTRRLQGAVVIELLAPVNEDVEASADAGDHPSGKALAEHLVLHEHALLELSSVAVLHCLAAAGRSQRRHVALDVECASRSSRRSTRVAPEANVSLEVSTTQRHVHHILSDKQRSYSAEYKSPVPTLYSKRISRISCSSQPSYTFFHRVYSLGPYFAITCNWKTGVVITSM